MSLEYITPHFTWKEAACHSGAAVPPDFWPNARRLASSVLEPLRERWGGPIVIISWYRTPVYNAGVGGAHGSQHLVAKAVDCRPADIEALPRFKALVEAMIHESKMGALGGMGWYPGRWLHLDIRDRPHDGLIVRWEGAGVGSELGQ